MSLRRRAVLAFLIAATTGCIPYAVATTAHPAPRGEPSPSAIFYSIPQGIDSGSDSTSLAFAGVDFETRMGVSDRADVGIRITSFSGLVASYKYLLTEPGNREGFAASAIGGLGLVNLGNHGYLEATVLASGPLRTLTPYGGVKMSKAMAISGAPSDSPTAGGFAGMRIGDARRALILELGVYHDESALELRSSSTIFVPSISVEGTDLLGLLGGRGRW